MFYITFQKARYDISELCCICRKFIRTGQFFVRSEVRIAHYKCAKKQGWKPKRRAKKISTPPPVENFPRPVKIIKRR